MKKLAVTAFTTIQTLFPILLIILLIILSVLLSLEDYRTKQQINAAKVVIDKVIEDNPDYAYDVLMESDEWENYYKY